MTVFDYTLGNHSQLICIRLAVMQDAQQSVITINICVQQQRQTETSQTQTPTINYS